MKINKKLATVLAPLITTIPGVCALTTIATSCGGETPDSPDEIAKQSSVYYLEDNKVLSFELKIADIANLCSETDQILEHTYTFSNGTSIERKNLAGIVFGEQFLDVTSIPEENFCRYLFAFNTFATYTLEKDNQFKLDFRGLKNVTSVGNGFFNGMFLNCDTMTKIPSGFNIPENISVVSDGFVTNMFFGCKKLNSLGSEFNLPQNITTLGSRFALNMFGGCEELASLPTKFNLPQKVTEVSNAFASNIFSGCKALKSLPVNFNLPKDIETVGNLFASGMFSGCETLTAMSIPTNFNLPIKITKIGNNFAREMFSGCENLTTLPMGFNIPKGIDSDVGDGFLNGMFMNCKGLISLPNEFNLPTSIIRAGEKFCENMFFGCTILFSLPDNFDFPTISTSLGDNFAYSMFSGCSNLQQPEFDPEAQYDLEALNFPNPSGGRPFVNYAQYCFSGTSIYGGGLNPVWESPKAGNVYYIVRNNS